MNLAFFTKIFRRCAQPSSSFAKTFLYVREAFKYTDKGNYFAMYRKNNICVSCVFNGFKYRKDIKAQRKRSSIAEVVARWQVHRHQRRLSEARSSLL